MGVLHMLAKAEADELLADWKGRSESPKPAPAEKQPHAYTVKTLAERWQCSDTHVRKLIKAGTLQVFRYGTMIRITPEAVAEVEKIRNR